MQVRFRLRELLTRQGVTGHGHISLVSEATGIERHKVSRLLEGAEDKISLKALAEICRFLIERCGVDPRELPGSLFEIEPSRFLDLLRQTPALRTCFGVRLRRPDSSASTTAGADSYLHGKLLELLLRPEPIPFTSQSPLAVAGSATRYSPAGTEVAALAPLRRHSSSEIQHFHQEQVHTASGPLPTDPEALAEELRFLRMDAERVDRVLHEPPPGRSTGKPDTLVKQVALMLGSVKSNPVCELAVARTFGAVPWGAHGRTAAEAADRRGELPLAKSPKDRAVPFFLRYREARDRGGIDPLIPSCHAGLLLSQAAVECGDGCRAPGIYYEQRDGTWDCAPWTADRYDAALVLYDYDRLLGNVDLVMGGFSSRGTRLLGNHLEQIVDHLFPASYETDRRAVGAFVIRFELPPNWIPASEQPGAPLRCEQEPTVIRLDERVIKRRLSGGR